MSTTVRQIRAIGIIAMPQVSANQVIGTIASPEDFAIKTIEHFAIHGEVATNPNHFNS